MSSWTLIAHAHTRHSPDCLTPPRDLARRAARLGAHVLAVTDHDSWRGSVEAREAALREGLPLQVVLASEVHTDQGDVIGLFLRNDLNLRSAPGFCDAVHEQGGLVLLPHPYRYHRLDEALLSRVDLIEVFNSRTARTDNECALRLAEQRGLPQLAGPDAHRLSELGLARVEFEGPPPSDEAGLKHALLHGRRRFHAEYGSVWSEWWSQAAKLARRPDPRLAWSLMRGAARRVLLPGDYSST